VHDIIHQRSYVVVARTGVSPVLVVVQKNEEDAKNNKQVLWIWVMQDGVKQRLLLHHADSRKQST
jgi:hypothetical protein